MHKKIITGVLIALVVVTTVLVSIFVLGTTTNIKKTQNSISYPAGRDTVEYYGDGTFQIEKLEDKNLRTLILTDVAKHIDLENQITNYREVDGKLYVFGIIGYTIIDWKTKEIKQHVVNPEYPSWVKNKQAHYGANFIAINDYNDFTSAERKVFDIIKSK